jgi:hypothetical protein
MLQVAQGIEQPAGLPAKNQVVQRGAILLHPSNGRNAIVVVNGVVDAALGGAGGIGLATLVKSLRLKPQLNALSERLEAKIEDQGKYLEAKIEDQGKYLEAKIEDQGKHLEAKIEDQGKYLEAKIEDQGESLRTDIRHLDAKIDAQGESLRAELRALTQSVTAIAVAMANRTPVS